MSSRYGQYESYRPKHNDMAADRERRQSESQNRSQPEPARRTMTLTRSPYDRREGFKSPVEPTSRHSEDESNRGRTFGMTSTLGKRSRSSSRPGDRSPRSPAEKAGRHRITHTRVNLDTVRSEDPQRGSTSSPTLERSGIASSIQRPAYTLANQSVTNPLDPRRRHASINTTLHEAGSSSSPAMPVADGTMSVLPGDPLEGALEAYWKDSWTHYKCKNDLVQAQAISEHALKEWNSAKSKFPEHLELCEQTAIKYKKATAKVQEIKIKEGETAKRAKTRIQDIARAFPAVLNKTEDHNNPDSNAALQELRDELKSLQDSNNELRRQIDGLNNSTELKVIREDVKEQRLAMARTSINFSASAQEMEALSSRLDTNEQKVRLLATDANFRELSDRIAEIDRTSKTLSTDLEMVKNSLAKIDNLDNRDMADTESVRILSSRVDDMDQKIKDSAVQPDTMKAFAYQLDRIEKTIKDPPTAPPAGQYLQRADLEVYIAQFNQFSSETSKKLLENRSVIAEQSQTIQKLETKVDQQAKENQQSAAKLMQQDGRIQKLEASLGQQAGSIRNLIATHNEQTQSYQKLDITTKMHAGLLIQRPNPGLTVEDRQTLQEAASCRRDILALKQRVQNVGEIVVRADFGIKSLTERCNNISTEKLARQMHAMNAPFQNFFQKETARVRQEIRALQTSQTAIIGKQEEFDRRETAKDTDVSMDNNASSTAVSDETIAEISRKIEALEHDIQSLSSRQDDNSAQIKSALDNKVGEVQNSLVKVSTAAADERISIRDQMKEYQKETSRLSEIIRVMERRSAGIGKKFDDEVARLNNLDELSKQLEKNHQDLSEVVELNKAMLEDKCETVSASLVKEGASVRYELQEINKELRTSKEKLGEIETALKATENPVKAQAEMMKQRAKDRSAERKTNDSPNPRLKDVKSFFPRPNDSGKKIVVAKTTTPTPTSNREPMGMAEVAGTDDEEEEHLNKWGGRPVSRLEASSQSSHSSSKAKNAAGSSRNDPIDVEMGSTAVILSSMESTPSNKERKKHSSKHKTPRK